MYKTSTVRVSYITERNRIVKTAEETSAHTANTHVKYATEREREGKRLDVIYERFKFHARLLFSQLCAVFFLYYIQYIDMYTMKPSERLT
jgi:hypothetical protein